MGYGEDVFLHNFSSTILFDVKEQYIFMEVHVLTLVIIYLVHYVRWSLTIYNYKWHGIIIYGTTKLDISNLINMNNSTPNLQIKNFHGHLKCGAEKIHAMGWIFTWVKERMKEWVRNFEFDSTFHIFLKIFSSLVFVLSPQYQLRS